LKVNNQTVELIWHFIRIGVFEFIYVKKALAYVVGWGIIISL